MARLFDADFSSSEQIPRRIKAYFRAEPGQFGDAVHLVGNGFRIGNPLTDNGWQ